MIPHSYRKLLHQHFTTLLHSRKTLTIALFTLLLFLVSLLQFSDTLLEWSVDKYRMIQHTHAHTDNIVGKSFEKSICYLEPVDVVYTWVNGSDPWHQRILDEYRDSQLVYKKGGTGAKDVSGQGKVSDDVSGNSTVDRQGVMCGSSNCVQANGVLISPYISMEDLSEVMDDESVSALISYNVSGRTFAMVPHNYDLDELLEDRTLDINRKKFVFVSVHLVVQEEEDVSSFACQPLPFARMLTGLDEKTTQEEVKMAFSVETQAMIRRVDLYRLRNVALVYFDEGFIGRRAQLRDEKMILGERPREVSVKKVCMLEDIKPSSSANELRPSRFKDNEELRYSIRSVEQHAGWVRRIFIVTNGQIPTWLDLTNQRIQIVTHEDIFLNKSHLPTFSSSAIESHLHRIPGLSKKNRAKRLGVRVPSKNVPEVMINFTCRKAKRNITENSRTSLFLYFNDDVLLGQDVLPEDFFSHSEGYKVPACSEGCPAGWIHDGFCDAACNNEYCNFDGGDCVNSSRNSAVFGDDDGEYIFSGTCHPGCLNAWLADRYCDAVCNHPECAFDAGDCGLDKLVKYPHVDLTAEQSEYWTPIGSNIIVFLTSGIKNHGEGTLKEGSYKQAKGVRVVSVYPQKNSIVMLLYPNATGFTHFTLDYVANGNTSQVFEPVVIKIIFDSTIQQQKEDEERDDFATKPPITFATVPAEKRKPRPFTGIIPYETADPGLNQTALLEHLQERLKTGELTEFGYEYRKSRVLGLPLSSSSATPFSMSSTPHPTRSSPLINKWSKHKKTFTTTASLPRAEDLQESFNRMSKKGAPRLVDAFADSLRYVNKLYNDAFGTESRKVPAHVPHFIDREVMAELQKQFPKEFDATSGTKIRGSQDMQFAFSYFYYVMASKKTVQAAEVFDELDRDHSGFLEKREIYMGALRSLMDGPAVPAKFQRFYLMFANCSSSGTPVNTSSVDLDHLEPISKSQVLACPELVHGLVALSGQQKRFKFRLGDAEGFTFVRAGNNVTRVNKELTGILRRPKKFICINDEVDYTREDAGAVQAAIGEFFQTLYPLPSRFELPPGTVGEFAHVSDLRDWERTRDMKRVAFGVLVGFAVLLVWWFCFPQQRRRIYRSFRRAYFGNGRDRHAIRVNLSA